MILTYALVTLLDNITSLATDGVAWSVLMFVDMSVATMSPEPIEMPFGIWTQVVPRNCVRWRSRSTMGRALLTEGMISGFSHMPLSTVTSVPDPDIGISLGFPPHAVDQRYSWPAAEAVECHIKFYYIQNPPAMCRRIPKRGIKM